MQERDFLGLRRTFPAQERARYEAVHNLDAYRHLRWVAQNGVPPLMVPSTTTPNTSDTVALIYGELPLSRLSRSRVPHTWTAR